MFSLHLASIVKRLLLLSKLCWKQLHPSKLCSKQLHPAVLWSGRELQRLNRRKLKKLNVDQNKLIKDKLQKINEV